MSLASFFVLISRHTASCIENCSLEIETKLFILRIRLLGLSQAPIILGQQVGFAKVLSQICKMEFGESTSHRKPHSCSKN